MENNTLVNRVAESGLITINLEDLFPTKSHIIFDIKEHLFHGLILKEKDFRESLKNLDWSIYQDKIVLITCSTDAVIPLWAYMLISVYLKDKGCGSKPVPSYAYTMITSRLIPDAQSIMFGEPCSTVPIYKRPRQILHN